MEKVKLTWDQIRSLEDKLYENVEKKVLKALSSIVEADVKPIAFTQDAVYFDKDNSSFRAAWSLKEDKISIKDLEEVEICEADIHEQLDKTTDELINALEEDKDPSDVWGKFLSLCEEKFSSKKKIRLLKVNEAKVIEEKSRKAPVSNIIKESINKLNQIILEYLGENEETEYVYDLKEDKVVKEKTPLKPVIRSLDESRSSAKKLNWSEFIADKHKFIDVNEEIFLLTKDEITKSLTEAAKYSFDMDDEDIPKEVNFIIEQREKHKDTIISILKPLVSINESDAVDDIIASADNVVQADKNKFLSELSTLLKEILVTVGEQSNNSDIKEKAEHYHKQLTSELDSEDGVDKDTLAELAKVTVELAATLEGHDDSAAADLNTSRDQLDTVDLGKQKTPADYQSSGEGKVKMEDDDEIEPMSADSNPDLVEPNDEPEAKQEKWKELHCDACDSDFMIDMDKVKPEVGDGDDVPNDGELIDSKKTQAGSEAPLPGLDKPKTISEDDDNGDNGEPEMGVEPKAEPQPEEPEQERCYVKCPYCDAEVSCTGKDDNDDIIDQEFDAGDEEENEVEEGSPAIEPSENPYMMGKGKKVNEQSPAADYEYVIKANAGSMLGKGKDNPGTKRGFTADNTSAKDDDAPLENDSIQNKGAGSDFKKDMALKKEDDTPKDNDSIQKKGATNSFKKLDNTSPKKEDSFVDGIEFGIKGGNFKTDNTSPKSDDDFIDGEDIVDNSQTHAGFKKDDNTSPKSDDQPADYQTLTQVIKVLTEKIYRSPEEEKLLEEAMDDLEALESKIKSEKK